MTRVSDRDRRKFAQLETTTCDAVWVTEAGTIELHLHEPIPWADIPAVLRQAAVDVQEHVDDLLKVHKESLE